ncbi:MAG: hypothetical protein Q9212_001276 [Teloschistes hypoglaucus]
MAYRVELASSKRAGCKNQECNKEKIKIDKGELRFGVWVTYKETASWSWRHWGCVTPAQIAGLQDTLEGEIEMLDGYEELPNDLQEKVKQAFDNGHVDDEDWKGDLEQNRPGKRGFRTPAAKKKKAEDKEDDQDQECAESPSKPAPRKRSRSKKDESENEEPAPKKVKAAARKGRKAKLEDDRSETSDEDPAALPVKAPKSKAKQAKNKAIALGKATKGKAKGSTIKELDVEPSAAAEVGEDAAITPEKTNVTSKKGKKSKKSDNQEDTAVATAAEVPHRAKSTARKVASRDGNDEDSLSEDDVQPAKTTRKPQSKGNTANTKKPIAKKAEAAKAEKPTAVAPKAKRGRKKADQPSTIE